MSRRNYFLPPVSLYKCAAMQSNAVEWSACSNDGPTPPIVLLPVWTFTDLSWPRKGELGIMNGLGLAHTLRLLPGVLLACLQYIRQS